MGEWEFLKWLKVRFKCAFAMMYLFWGGLSFLVAFYYRDQLKLFEIKIGHFVKIRVIFLSKALFRAQPKFFKTTVGHFFMVEVVAFWAWWRFFIFGRLFKSFWSTHYFYQRSSLRQQKSQAKNLFKNLVLTLFKDQANHTTHPPY